MKEDVGNVPVWVKIHGVLVTTSSEDGVSVIATKLDSGVAKNLKKPSQAPIGVSVGPKVGFKPAKQVYRSVFKKTKTNTSGNKKKEVEPTKENVESSSTSTTPIVEKIDKIERLIINGKVTLVDDKDKRLENVDLLGNHDSKDEVDQVYESLLDANALNGCADFVIAVNG
ncbi:hypothetical protein Tco_0157028 [Tanacetum coccineum]